MEGLAVVYGLQKFRPYLLGVKFKIPVDHCALCVLAKKVPNSARLHRWAIILSEFDFDVEYTKGSSHSNVDCLSRSPVNSPDDQYLERMYYVCRPVDVDNWVPAYSDEATALIQLADRIRLDVPR